MRLIPTRFVKDGMYLAQTLNDMNNRVLLQKGVELSQNLVKKIEGNGIYSIYINDEYSDNEIEDIISPRLRNTAIKTIKDTFNHLNKYMNQNNNTIAAKRLKDTGEKNIQSLNKISKEITEEVFDSGNVLINLVDIKSLDNYTYQHSVNVAVLSLILGIEIGLNKNELYDLCIGAMLHDVGKAFIPKEILLKRGMLTAEEFKIIKQHSKKGYDYLKENYELNANIKLIAYQHHEKVDGTGYPNGYKEDKINKLAKIVAITDAYDAMVSDTPYKPAVAPNEALEFIMGSAGRYFDFQMVKLFAKKVIPYPVGSMVKLSNGEIGVVEEIQSEFPLRPKVKVVKQRAVTVEMKTVDLMKEKNVVIEELIYEVPNVNVPRKMGEKNSFKSVIE
ncbi:HD-GYP domain-containing protein [Crassaminicella profunda]|uniref:HD-GYP domain-containing protein n=1 Tax=Crassaminicella profunda TaxID=1286698 RepID=UPI001CA6C750|nr:HD-GYP domain-containing protein [Crassaminicella profunda]QZY54151.1 HD-GYP domain-containing protein [Crassaminicella profunda]